MNKKLNLTGIYLCNSKIFRFIIVFMSALIISCSPQTDWMKGNMHTHTFWSDGDEFPENVTKWYKENGYNFLVLTDHNLITEGERWRSFPPDHPVLKKYIENYGNDLAEMKPDDKEPGNTQVKLKTFSELKSVYSDQGKFILVQGNEISCPHAVHLTSFYVDKVIPAAKGTADQRSSMIRQVLLDADEYRDQSERNTYPALAHPNFTWAITAEMILENPSLRFFEVYNGHPAVHNDGDVNRAGTERIWDIVLAHRMNEKDGILLYGLASDDAHNYHGGGAGPGKGWVMVRSDKLNPEKILGAMYEGDFYSSTGVTINKINFNGKTITIEIQPSGGVQYLTEFIGTRRGFDISSSLAIDSAGVEIQNTTRIYSDQIGAILASSNDVNPSYSFSGDELYIRARITSTADHIDPLSGKVLGKQRAWVQPVAGIKKKQ